MRSRQKGRHGLQDDGPEYLLLREMKGKLDEWFENYRKLVSWMSERVEVKKCRR